MSVQPEELSHKATPKWIGRVVVTILLVLLILIIGLAIDDYRKASQRSAKPPCLANLLQINGAKATWALEWRKTTNDTPTWSDLIGTTLYIVDQPECPKGGVYTLGRVGEKASCTVPGDH